MHISTHTYEMPSPAPPIAPPILLLPITHTAQINQRPPLLLPPLSPYLLQRVTEANILLQRQEVADLFFIHKSVNGRRIAAGAYWSRARGGESAASTTSKHGRQAHSPQHAKQQL